ncbi:MAG: hypothetical protein KF718_01225 [Polyangiaceae bacterium]|nr:hypothetical protein [Polyangiaceae bacterium]
MELEPMCGWPNGGVIFGEYLCVLPLDFGPATEPEALAHVDVHFGPTSGAGWDGGGRMLRVAGPKDCASTGNGWYFDDPSSPTAIHICPSACECAKKQPGHFSIVFGCWTNAAPGVMDAEIACPRCAEHRPNSCGKATAGFGFGVVKCAFPLQYDWDPAHTNLKYVQHGAVAGPEEPWDGYLTWVPSLEYCDHVEEGWTYDMTTNPPTVLVCPSACSCAEVKGAMLMLEAGCPRLEWNGG